MAFEANATNWFKHDQFILQNWKNNIGMIKFKDKFMTLGGDIHFYKINYAILLSICLPENKFMNKNNFEYALMSAWSQKFKWGVTIDAGATLPHIEGRILYNNQTLDKKQIYHKSIAKNSMICYVMIIILILYSEYNIYFEIPDSHGCSYLATL